LYADRDINLAVTPTESTFTSSGLSDARAAFERCVTEQDAKEKAQQTAAGSDDDRNDSDRYGTLGRELGMGPGQENLRALAVLEEAPRKEQIKPLQARALGVKIGELHGEGLDPAEIETTIRQKVEFIVAKEEARASFHVSAAQYRASTAHQAARQPNKDVEEDQGPSMDM